jgi:hypothetical protein
MKINYEMLGNGFSLHISDTYYRDHKPQMLTDVVTGWKEVSALY